MATPSPGVLAYDEPDTAPARRRHQLAYSLTTVALIALLALAVLDGLHVVDVYGVDTTTTRAAARGVELEVRHPTVARAGLAAPFEITVRRPGGFDRPVVVAVDAHYLALWDENGLDPRPASATSDGDRILWTFAPPLVGSTLTIGLDARIEPGVHRGRDGHVAVLDGGREVVAVSFATRILP